MLRQTEARRSLHLVTVALCLILGVAFSGIIAPKRVSAATGCPPSIEANTETQPLYRYRIYLQDSQGSNGDSVVSLQERTTGLCYRIIPNALPLNGWRSAGFVDPKAQQSYAVSGGFGWTNIGRGYVNSIMLVASDVTCKPVTLDECQEETTAGRTIYQARRISGKLDTLPIYAVDSQLGKHVLEAITYIDGQEAYRKPALEPVDTRYMLAGTHEVQTRVINTDGSEVIYYQNVVNDQEDFSNYYFVYFGPRLWTFGLVATVLGSLFVSMLIVAFGHFMYRRYLWLKTHNLLRH